MAGSAYEYFFQALGDWGSAIPLEGQWFVYFDLESVNALKKDVGEAIRVYDSSPDWQLGNGIVSQLKKSLYNPPIEKLIGCVFARQVILPGETINTSNDSLKYGGYLGPVTSSNRESYNKLSIVFNETNASFIDFILRPWTILVGYNGLIARGPNSPKNVKCKSVELVYLAKTGMNSPMAKRKIISFYNVVPVSIESSMNTYSADGLTYAKVDFAYDYYSVKEADSSTILTGNATSPSVASAAPNTTKTIPLNGNPTQGSLDNQPRSGSENSTGRFITRNGQQFFQASNGALIPVESGDTTSIPDQSFSAQKTQ
jgi:hypothetical protein